MSEPNNTFPFSGMEDSEDLDISAIFGDSAGGSDTNPFDTPAAQAQEAPEDQTQKPDDSPATESANPIAAAIDQQAEKTVKTAAKSLFEKPPIFAYGSARDEITDGDMTFEELRIAKADDFPELGEGERVSWTVEYGKATRQISDPKGTTFPSPC